MGKDFGTLRRRAGIVCLAVPAGMVILGQTGLKSSLDGVFFLAYWLICFVFTFAAMFIALGEIRAIRTRTREETRELMEKTLEEVERQQDKKS